ncbi:Uncharacterized protein Adt_03235 [Abeliophyllum distichum]|uniref:Uncharacterized protein n=1 Tax=Abeliophyllum distichum TaxID=126358 RepID=A0ABD1VY61_9LAMI
MGQRNQGNRQERKNDPRIERPERNWLQQPAQHPIREIDTIIGGPILEEAQMILKSVVAKNGLKRSFVNIIYRATYDKIGIEAHLILATDPNYGFTRDSIVLRKTIILMTEMEEAPTTVRTPIEYLVVEKALHTMVFLEVIENQSESRTCYTNAMKKFVDQKVNTIDVEMKEVSSDLERLDGGPEEEDE